MSAIDELDQQILDILREDSRTSNREVARRIGVPEGRVRGRIKKLLDDRVICFSLIMNPMVAGYKVSAYVRFAVEDRHLQAAADHLCSLENVILVSLIGGRYNILTTVVARSHSDLARTISGPWRDKYGVLDTDVRIFFRAPKHRYDLMRQPG